MARFEKEELIDFIINSDDQFSDDDRDKLEVFNEDQLEVMATNLAVENKGKKGCMKNTNEEEEEVPEEEMEEEEEEVKNMTPQKVMNMLPKEYQQVLNEAVEIRNQHRSVLIDQIVSNAKNTFTKKQLEGMDVKSLQSIATLATNDSQEPVANWMGAVGSFGTKVSNESLGEEGLTVPVLNYSELAKGV